MRINDVLPPHPREIDKDMFWNDKERYFKMMADRDEGIQNKLKNLKKRGGIIRLKDYHIKDLEKAGIVSRGNRRCGNNCMERYWVVKFNGIIEEFAYNKKRLRHHYGDEFGHSEWDPT